MKLEISSSQFFYGTTPLENLFISTYMLNANPIYSQIYILMYFYAYNHSKINIRQILNDSNLNYDILYECLMYWKEQELIEVINYDDNIENINIILKNINDIYIFNSYNKDNFNNLKYSNSNNYNEHNKLVLKKSKLNFGNTPIENIFIEKYIKNNEPIYNIIYIILYYYSYNNLELNLNKITKLLNIENNIFNKAILYWENQDIITINDDKSITLKNINDIYINKTYQIGNTSPMDILKKYEDTKNMNLFYNENNKNKFKIKNDDISTSELFKKIEELIKLNLTKKDYEDLCYWYIDLNLHSELILLAFSITLEKNIKNYGFFKYTYKILNNFVHANIRTLDDYVNYQNTVYIDNSEKTSTNSLNNNPTINLNNKSYQKKYIKSTKNHEHPNQTKSMNDAEFEAYSKKKLENFKNDLIANK